MKQKINIFLTEKLHAQIKAVAALKGISMESYMEKSIANGVDKEKKIFEELL